jgi:hypothetical protein
MITMSTDFTTIYNDMKSSLKLARSKMLTYFLANLGMLFVIVGMLAIVAIPVGLAVWAMGPAYWHSIGPSMASWAASNPLAVGGIALLFIIPFVSLFLIVVGSIYGMSKDLVATGDTRAEAAFSWFRRKFLTFAGAGVMLTIVIVIPPLTVSGLVSIALNYTVTGLPAQLLAVFTFVWVFITVGLCANVFPAITYGKGVQDAFKESFKLATTRFERVFGLLVGIILLALITFGPAIVWGLWHAYTMTLPPLIDPISIAVMAWSAIAAFLWLLLFLPMTIIAFTKVYAELTGGEIATPSTPNVPLV